jgi:hypothetical protein
LQRSNEVNASQQKSQSERRDARVRAQGVADTLTSDILFTKEDSGAVYISQRIPGAVSLPSRVKIKFRYVYL